MFCLFLWLTLLALIKADCMRYWKGDDYFNDQVQNSSYCANIITWPISDITAGQYQLNDAIARSLYDEIKVIYRSDCLGIARFFFCAYAYPTCSDDNMSIPKTCNWLCNLWTIRCPTQTSFFSTICNQTDAVICSWEPLPLLYCTMTLILFVLMV